MAKNTWKNWRNTKAWLEKSQEALKWGMRIQNNPSGFVVQTMTAQPVLHWGWMRYGEQTFCTWQSCKVMLRHWSKVDLSHWWKKGAGHLFLSLFDYFLSNYYFHMTQNAKCTTQSMWAALLLTQSHLRGAFWVEVMAFDPPHPFLPQIFIEHLPDVRHCLQV